MSKEVNENYEGKDVRETKHESESYTSNEKERVQSASDRIRSSWYETSDAPDKDIEIIKKNYISDLKTNSECPDTISDKALESSKLEHRTPEETKAMREEFNVKRNDIIKEWEEKNGREWPKYDKDIVDENGKIVKKQGYKYDAHHIIPLSMGGENTAENITPLSYNVHSDHKGVHSKDSPYSQLENEIRRDKK